MRLGELRLSEQEGIQVAGFTGDIDLSNATDISNAITEAISNDARGVVLDLSAVDYLDSAGIHLVFRMRDALRARGQKLILVVADGSLVARTLELASVSSQVAVEPTLEAAIGAFA
jgi:anti-anti-sigma factor